MRSKQEQRIHTALERWLRRDPGCRASTRAVRKAQAELRRAVTDEVWDLYLALEERTNARHVDILCAAIDLALRDKSSRTPARKRSASSPQR